VNNSREDIVKEHEKLLIIDFGSQVTKLIARRVRESGVYSEVHPFNKVDAALIKSFKPKAIILSGGPNSVTGTGTPRAHDAVWESGLPVLGIRNRMNKNLAGRSSTPQVAVHYLMV